MVDIDTNGEGIMKISYFDFKHSGKRLLIWIFLMSFILIGGCVAIPVGTDVLERDILSQKQVVLSEKSTGLEIKQEPPSVLMSESSTLNVKILEKTEKQVGIETEERQKVHVRKLIVGVWAVGVGKSVYFKEPFKKDRTLSEAIGLEQHRSEYFLGMIFAAGTLYTGPTLVWLLGEPFQPWGLPNRTYYLFSGPSPFTLWAKTGYDDTRKITIVDEKQIKPFFDPVSGIGLICRDSATGFEVRGISDASGEVKFDPSKWPYIELADDLNVEIAVDKKTKLPLNTGQPEKLQIKIPHQTVGENLADALRQPNYPYDTIYIDEKQVDFTRGTPKLAPRPLVKAEIVEQLSNDPSILRVKLTAQNKGRGTLYRFFGKTRSDIDLLNNHLIIFGKLKPGETITRELKLPIRTISEKDRAAVDIEFFETNNNQPTSLSLNIDGQTLSRPILAYTYTIIDDPARSKQAVGNGDGIIQIGESVDLVVTVKNTGKAAARNAALEIQMPENPSLTIYGDTRIPLGDLPSESTVSKILNVQVKPTSTMSQISVQVSLSEDSFLFSLNEKTILPFNAKIQPAIIAINEIRYVVEQTAVMRKGAAKDSPEYGRAPRGTRLKAIGEIGDWLQVEVPKKDSKEKERVWIARQATSHEQPEGEMQTVPIVVTQFKMPPVITFVEPAGDICVTEAAMRVVASVTSASSSLNNVSLYIASPPYKNFVKRGIKISPKESVKDTEFSRGERILRDLVQLPLGKTDIKIVAENDLGEISERSISITRTEKIGETYLLSVGVNKYPGAKALNCAVSDAEMFYNFAKNSFAVDDPRSWLLTDQSATRDAIMGRMAEITGKVKKEDSVIIFLAGHGHIERLGTMEEKYFVPYLEQWGGFVSRGIAMSDFKRLLSSMAAEKIFVIADACYSGELIAMRGGKLFSGLGGKGRIVLGYEGPAREDAQLGHGYLTYYFVDGIRTGKADQNKDDRISIREAYEYADEKIKRITGEGLWIKGEGDLIWNQ